MIKIQLINIGKKFSGQWIFRGLTDEITGVEKVAITGYNGSGKSTLLQILAAFQSPSEGSISFEADNKIIAPENWYKYLSCGTPYLDLPEDLSLSENVAFHSSFKPVQQSLSSMKIAEIAELHTSINKPVKHFSSGMKQRLRLSLAILADVPVLLLDEPLSNLDEKGVLWYHMMINQYAKNKIIIVCSNNQKDETSFCNRTIDINNFK